MHPFSKPLSLIASRLRPCSHQVGTPLGSGRKMLQTKSMRSFSGGEKIRQYQGDTHDQQGRSKEDSDVQDKMTYIQYLGSYANLVQRYQDQLINQDNQGGQQKDPPESPITGDCARSASRTKISRIINIRGAIERTVRHAVCIKKLKEYRGMQCGLSELAHKPEFIRLLQAEAKARKLKPDEITTCAHNLYDELSKHVHGKEGAPITIRATDFPVNERAALAAFMTLLKRSEVSLKWKEVPAEEERGRTIGSLITATAQDNPKGACSLTGPNSGTCVTPACSIHEGQSSKSKTTMRISQPAGGFKRQWEKIRHGLKA
ncbi:unnamed protein product [Tuber aestivum]|uniref:Uncharacterized protein n=1 Tax=Tuber aestivum TaxID=59557 RepID=A0A292PYP9_9PEZI|nr:unnamed protein product [Tuber aestivum]